MFRPSAAAGQDFNPDAAIGERYHVEVVGTLWNPNLVGLVSSEQFGLAGTPVSFADDLGYQRTRFGDLRIVLRPTKKAKFRIQYTPMRYEAAVPCPRREPSS